MKWTYPLWIRLNKNGKGSFVMDDSSQDYSGRTFETYTPDGEDVAIKLGKIIGRVTKSMVRADDSMDMSDDLGLPVYSVVSSKCLDSFE